MAPHNLAARGYHSFRCLGVPFHVKQRYTFVRELGIGAYGCVALCRDELFARWRCFVTLACATMPQLS